MDDGLIASRYAKAFVRYVLETGNGTAVCRDLITIGDALSQVGALRMILDDPEGIPDSRKLALLKTALGGSMEPETERFLEFLLEKKRFPLARLVIQDFIVQYHRSAGEVYGTLTTAREPSEAFVERVKAMIRKKTGLEPVLRLWTDPELIGGFVLDLGDRRMDATVKHQLDTVRKRLVTPNRRIV